MRITAVVQALVGDLSALGALGDEATADAARRLATAMEGPLTARLLESFGQIASEFDPTIPNGHIEVRLVGADAGLVFVNDEQADGARSGEADDTDGDADSSARITLRLPSQLKARIETASAQDGVSVNTYIVRALSQQSRGERAGPRVGRRMSGYGRS